MGERQDERKVQAPKGDPPLVDIQGSASAQRAGYDLMLGVLGSGAREISLTGRSCDAQEALAGGLVDRVVERGERLAAARAAREIGALPEETPENAKRGFVAPPPPPLES